MKDSNLPERIRSKRGSRGRKGYLSQFALAVKLGVSCALVQKAESGAKINKGSQDKFENWLKGEK